MSLVLLSTFETLCTISYTVDIQYHIDHVYDSLKGLQFLANDNLIETSQLLRREYVVLRADRYTCPCILTFINSRAALRRRLFR